jgi:hypothetical protein
MRIASKATLPEAIADENDVLTSDLFVFGQEITSKNGFYTQRRQKVR